MNLIKEKLKIIWSKFIIEAEEHNKNIIMNIDENEVNEAMKEKK